MKYTGDSVNAEEKAYNYLSQYSRSSPSIDSLIYPLCKLLNEHHYITIYSCSGHVKTVRFKNYFFKKNNWYIAFVSCGSIEMIKNIVNKININERNIHLKLEKHHFEELTNTWVLRLKINFNYNDQQLFILNKTIYFYFKEGLLKKEEIF